MVERENNGLGRTRGEARNTREVVPIRLSPAERTQIASGAARLKLTLSGFIRQAALQASAVVERKASVKAPEPPEPSYREPVLLLEDEPEPHYVDGELVLADLMPRKVA
jgi:uncharacterized protein (DUF1778 family)